MRFHDVTVQYGRETALHRLDLHLERGVTMALVGPNGAGKTTAIRVACGLVRPTSGTVTIDGVRQPAATAPSIGYCPQEDICYESLTVAENLDYVGALFGVPLHRRVPRVHELVAAVGLAAKADTRARRLSGGMRRRLTIAMACVHDPALLLVEEPEAGLDPTSRRVVREFLADQGRTRTILFTSHSIPVVERLADEVAVLDRGRVVALGPPAAVTRFVGAGAKTEGPAPPHSLAQALQHWTGVAA